MPIGQAASVQFERVAMTLTTIAIGKPQKRIDVPRTNRASAGNRFFCVSCSSVVTGS
jgi:hypothetical protein